MRPAAERLSEALQDATFRIPAIPVLHNVDVTAAGSVEAMKQRLVEQLYSPVRWVETVEAIGARGAQRVIEAGPGKVLAGLIKRIDKSLEALPVFDPASLDIAMESINA